MYAFILAIEDDRQREYMTELVEQYKSRMYNFAYKYLRNRQDAEDAVQEAFIKIFRNIDDYIDHSVDDVGLQVFYCTKSSVIDYYRKRKRKRDIPLVYSMDDQTLEYEIADDTAIPEKVAINNETKRILAECIEKLPDQQRQVFVLKYRMMYKESKIAEILNVSESSVSSAIYRGKKNLMKMLWEYYNG